MNKENKFFKFYAETKLGENRMKICYKPFDKITYPTEDNNKKSYVNMLADKNITVTIEDVIITDFMEITEQEYNDFMRV